MKRIYLLLALIIGMVSSAYAESTSQDYDYYLTVYADGMMVNMCYVEDNNGQEYSLSSGTNTFTGTYRETTEKTTEGTTITGNYVTSYTLRIRDGYISNYTLSACTVSNAGNSSDYGNSTLYPTNSLSLTTYLTWNQSSPYYTLTPTLSSLVDLRTASATVTINDASKVRITCGSYEPSLYDGTQTISFNPSSESSWTIGPKESGQYLDSVTKNGSPIASEGNYYKTNVSSGDNINITAQIAAESCNVTFSFENDGTSGAVTAVYPFINYVKGEAYANWLSGITVDKNAMIIVSLNQADYNVTGLTLNGTSNYINDDNYLQITANTDIHITATKYATQDVTFDLSNAESVAISMGASQYGSQTPLNDLVTGTQTLSISQKMQYLFFSEKSGGVIDGVSYKNAGDAEFTEVAYNYGYVIPISEGMTVKVTSHMISRDKKVSLYVNDISKFYTLNVQSSDGSTYLLSKDGYGGPIPTTGWNDFYIDSFDNPVELKFQKDSEHDSYVLQNGVKKESTYTGNNTYSLTLAENDQIKVYVDATYTPGAESKSLRINVDDPAKAVIKKATSRDNSGTVLNGLDAGDNNVEVESTITYLVVTPADGEAISSVSYQAGAGSATPVSPEEGVYYVPVVDGTSVTIETVTYVPPTYDYSITLKFDNPSAIEKIYRCTDYSGESIDSEITAISSTMEVGYSSSTNSIKIVTKDGYSFNTYKFTSSNGSVNGPFSDNYRAEHIIVVAGSSGYNGALFEFIMADMEALRSNTATVTVNGDPEKVVLQLSQTNYKPVLHTGDNTIKFMDCENQFSIDPAAGKTLYSVSLNGTEQEKRNGSSTGWTLTVNNNDAIVIETEFPDDTYNVSFTFSLANSSNFVNQVYINEVPVPDWQDGFTAHAGDRLYFTVSSQLYNCTGFTVNGASASLSGYYQTTISSDLAFYFTLAEYAKTTAHVKVDDYTRLRYSTDNGNTYTDAPSNNFDIEVNESGASYQYIYLQPINADEYIVSVTVTEPSKSAYENTYMNAWYVYGVDNGMTLDVKTGKLDRTNTAYFYIDDMSALTNSSNGYNGCYFSNHFKPGENIELVQGHNKIDFDATKDNPFSFKISNSSQTSIDNYIKIYKNGVLMEKGNHDGYSGSTWTIECTNKDVYKVYYSYAAVEKKTFSVTMQNFANPPKFYYDFNLNEAINLTPASVRHSVIARAASVSGFSGSVLPGTHVTVDPNGNSIVVTKNGVSVPADSAGNYGFDITGDDEVAIYDPIYTGIENVGEDEMQDTRIFNIHGIEMKKENLPAGIYIINGKKVVKN